jgi:hypothetical protein
MKYRRFPNLFNLVVILLVLCFLSACVPGIKKTLAVDGVINLTGGAFISSDFSPAAIRISSIVDSRTVRRIGEIGGTRYYPGGNVALNVKKAFLETFRKKGIETTDREAPLLSVQINRWYVSAEKSIPLSEAKAVADIAITLRDATGSIRHTSSHIGTAETVYLFFSEANAEKVLAKSMAAAITEAVEEPVLTDNIWD